MCPSSGRPTFLKGAPTMQEFLDRVARPGGEHILGLVLPIVILLILAAMVAIVQWRKYRQAGMEASLNQRIIDLKQQMIERGMSADEMERVLNARPATASQPGAVGDSRLKETADC